MLALSVLCRLPKLLFQTDGGQAYIFQAIAFRTALFGILDLTVLL